MATRPTIARRPKPADLGASDETRERLLQAAEALFLELGYDGTTLRLVAARAQANIAGANYHFGGKDALLQTMLARRLDALAHARLALLASYDRDAAHRPLDCDRALAALCAPALAIARDPARGGADFLRLLGRAYVDPSPVLRTFLSERYSEATARIKEAFARVLPHLSARELSWRLHFVLGALSYTLARTDAWRLIATIRGEDEDDERLLARLTPFLIAGLQAPRPDLATRSLAGGADFAPLIGAPDGRPTERRPQPVAPRARARRSPARRVPA
jgi:AcrR family transcriptional regulator